MHVLALEVDIHLPAAQSLKDKRSLVKPLLEGARRRFGVAVAEVDSQDLRQRAQLGFAVVADSERHAVEVMDQVDRFVWSHPEIEVLSSERRWLA
jgi:uncharacterized protein YlxP (DUF503 family)